MASTRNPAADGSAGGASESDLEKSVGPEYRKSLDQAITALAELYPGTFTAERWKPHRPLKIGIDQNIIAAGLLTAEEAERVLRRYTGRLQYQRSVVVGAARIDLSGNSVDLVTPEQAAHAAKRIRRIESRAAAQAQAATAAHHQESGAS
jgi:sRNA-binding protein